MVIGIWFIPWLSPVLRHTISNETVSPWRTTGVKTLLYSITIFEPPAVKILFSLSFELIAALYLLETPTSELKADKLSSMLEALLDSLSTLLNESWFEFKLFELTSESSTLTDNSSFKSCEVSKLLFISSAFIALTDPIINNKTLTINNKNKMLFILSLIIAPFFVILIIQNIINNHFFVRSITSEYYTK